MALIPKSSVGKCAIFVLQMMQHEYVVWYTFNKNAAEEGRQVKSYSANNDFTCVCARMCVYKVPRANSRLGIISSLHYYCLFCLSPDVLGQCYFWGPLLFGSSLRI